MAFQDFLNITHYHSVSDPCQSICPEHWQTDEPNITTSSAIFTPQLALVPSKSAILHARTQPHSLHAFRCRLPPASSVGSNRRRVANARTQHSSSRNRSKTSSNPSAEIHASNYMPAICALWAQRKHQRTYGRLLTIYSCNKCVLDVCCFYPTMCVFTIPKPICKYFVPQIL